jgi:outer membrane protein OmpA-like peptidoglycan-associated protein
MLTAMVLAAALQGSEPARLTTFHPIVYFEHGSAALPSSAKETAREAAAYAKRFGFSTLVVVSHCDRSGPEDVNLRLARERGAAVAEALAAEGVALARIRIEAVGEDRPAVLTEDGVAEPLNRRATIDFER